MKWVETGNSSPHVYSSWMWTACTIDACVGCGQLAQQMHVLAVTACTIHAGGLYSMPQQQNLAMVQLLLSPSSFGGGTIFPFVTKGPCHFVTAKQWPLSFVT